MHYIRTCIHSSNRVLFLNPCKNFPENIFFTTIIQPKEVLNTNEEVIKEISENVKDHT